LAGQGCSQHGDAAHRRRLASLIIASLAVAAPSLRPESGVGTEDESEVGEVICDRIDTGLAEGNRALLILNLRLLVKKAGRSSSCFQSILEKYPKETAEKFRDQLAHALLELACDEDGTVRSPVVGWLSTYLAGKRASEGAIALMQEQSPRARVSGALVANGMRSNRSFIPHLMALIDDDRWAGVAVHRGPKAVTVEAQYMVCDAAMLALTTLTNLEMKPSEFYGLQTPLFGGIYFWRADDRYKAARAWREWWKYAKDRGQENWDLSQKAFKEWKSSVERKAKTEAKLGKMRNGLSMYFKMFAACCDSNAGVNEVFETYKRSPKLPDREPKELIKFLKRKEPTVRASAVVSLGLLGNKSALPPVMAMLEDEAEAMREDPGEGKSFTTSVADCAILATYQLAGTHSGLEFFDVDPMFLHLRFRSTADRKSLIKELRAVAKEEWRGQGSDPQGDHRKWCPSEEAAGRTVCARRELGTPQLALAFAADGHRERGRILKV